MKIKICLIIKIFINNLWRKLQIIYLFKMRYVQIINFFFLIKFEKKNLSQILLLLLQLMFLFKVHTRIIKIIINLYENL